MNCTSCGKELPTTAKFCTNCGTKVSRESYCPQCGTQVSATAKFCHYCGTKLATDTPQPEYASEIQQYVQPPKPQEPQIDVELLCPHCHGQFSVPEEDWGKDNIYWICPNCNGKIEVAFCGYCNHHHGYIAFRPYNTQEILGATIIGGIAGYNDPEGAIYNLVGSFFDSTPTALSQGVCPKCQAEFVKCPTCYRAVHIRFEDGGVVSCPDCRTRFKMN